MERLGLAQRRRRLIMLASFDPEALRVAWDALRGQLNRDATSTAALQGFPLGYAWSGTKTAQARCIGNALPPPLAKAIAQALETAMAVSPQSS